MTHRIASPTPCFASPNVEPHYSYQYTGSDQRAYRKRLQPSSKRLGRAALTISWVLWLLMPLTSHAEPLDGLLLFSNPKAQSFQLSPDTAFIGAVLGDDKGPYFSLIKTDDLQNYRLFRLSTYSIDYIRTFHWLDNHSLYLLYQSKERTYGAIFNFELKQGVPFGRGLSYIDYTGSLIDAMPYSDNTALFFLQEETRQGRKRLPRGVYAVEPSQLVTQSIKRDDLVQADVEGALYFATDNDHRIRMAVANRDDTLHILGKNAAEEWVDFYTINAMSTTFMPIGMLATGEVAVLSSESFGTTALMAFDLGSKSYTRTLFYEANHNLVDAELTDDGTGVKSVSYFDHGAYATRYFNAKANRLNALLAKAFPGKEVNIVSERPGHPLKVLLVTATNAPGTFLLFNADTLVAQYLTDAYPQLAASHLLPSVTHTYQDAHNNAVEAIVTAPETANGVLLFIPQAGNTFATNLGGFNRTAQYFASRGFTVAQVNYVANAANSDVYQNGGLGSLAPVLERDLSFLLPKLRQQYGTRKTCTLGASYASLAALSLAITNPAQVQCAIGLYGIYDLAPFFAREEPFVQLEFNRWMNQTLTPGPISYDTLSPLQQASKLHVPVLLIAGEKDSLHKVEQTQAFAQALREQQKNVTSQYYPNNGNIHHLWNGDYLDHAAISEFIEQQLHVYPPAVANHPQRFKDLNWLAEAYAMGKHVAEDDRRAFDIYRRSIDLDDPLGAYFLGRYYAAGEVVPADFEQAERFYQKANSLGIKSSKYGLGELYSGTDFPEQRDLEKAKRYFAEAAEGGSTAARLALAKLLAAENTEQSIRAALEWLSGFAGGVKNDRRLLPILDTIDRGLGANDPARVALGEFIEQRFTTLRPGKDRIKVVQRGVFYPDTLPYFYVPSSTIDTKTWKYVGAKIRLTRSSESRANDKQGRHPAIVRMRWQHADDSAPSIDEFTLLWPLTEASVTVESRRLTTKKGKWTLTLHALDGTQLEKTRFYIK